MKINIKDAITLGIKTGEMVSVSSIVGEIEVETELSDEMMQGVVSIPQGWGHNQPNTNMEVASGQPGVSVNNLTNEKVVDELTGNAVFSGVNVSIKALQPFP
jgi:anaerobic selenocysteine-containing dehydrogenase